MLVQHCGTILIQRGESFVFLEGWDWRLGLLGEIMCECLQKEASDQLFGASMSVCHHLAQFVHCCIGCIPQQIKQQQRTFSSQEARDEFAFMNFNHSKETLTGSLSVCEKGVIQASRIEASV